LIASPEASRDNPEPRPVNEELLAEETTELPDEPLTLVRRPVYEVRLEAFQGPLDLLLHLIREHEIDIYDIPIAQITEQYLEYLEFMESLDLALAGEFLEMAATLIRIKVQMLLPSVTEEGEEEEDPRQQLVRKLVEYRKFKEVAGRLSTWEEDRRQHVPRGVDVEGFRDPDAEALETEELLRDVTLFDLVDGLREVLSRVPKRIDVHQVDLEHVTVEEQMERIRSTLREAGSVSFVSLFVSSSSRTEVVTTFIALLELIRLGFVRATQKRVFGEILIEPGKKEEQ
jgi:segregation and condensation protein A